MNLPYTCDRKSLFLSLVFFIFLVLVAGGMAVYVLSDTGLEKAYSLARAVVTIEKAYPERVGWDKLYASARNGMLDRLDRYSGYMETAQFEALDQELTGGYTGIGITVVKHEDGLLIISVRESGPAAEVGLLAGDIITAADSISIVELEPEEAARRLRGKQGTKVLLDVIRPATDEVFTVEVSRRRIPFLHIPFAGCTADSLIYIRLWDFDPGAARDLRHALDSLLREDRTSPKGLILDLTSNPGGLFMEAFDAANLFLGEGVLMVGTDGRSHWNDRRFYSTGADITGGLPMAVIVDRGSASAAEIVAGALQQTGRAVLVGDTTFGKGLVQGFVRFPGGDGLKLTVSRYYFAGPLFLNDFDSALNDVGHGLVPDFYLNLHQVNQFRRALESSLLLRQFGNLYQDDIIGDVENGGLDDEWIDRMVTFARCEGFVYESTRTGLTEELKELAAKEACSGPTKTLAEKIVAISRSVDQTQFYSEAEYIKSRLMQIAYESKYGPYQAYKEVLVKTRPEIAFASRILLKRE